MSKRNGLSRKSRPLRQHEQPGAGHPRGPERQTRPAPHGGGHPSGRPEPGGAYWIYGQHAVRAALANPNRRFRRLLLADNDPAPAKEIEALSSGARGGSGGPVAVETMARAELARKLPEGAVHQGVAAQVAPLPVRHLDDVLAAVEGRSEATVLLLDQVTDPHNVGAILRSAAAFGAVAVLVTDRNAPPETGALAKAASGALEVVPLVRVPNLARALDRLKQAGFWSAGLAADGPQTLAEARLSGRVALVLGAEGDGLRRLTRAHCDYLVRLPTSGPIGHLNVSNAAAIALYELARERGGTASGAEALSDARRGAATPS